MSTPEERFAGLVAALADDPDVTGPLGGSRRFGSDALTTDGKIFAMLYEGALVVKLPAERVEGLVAAGEGERFGRSGRPMREWLALDAGSDLDWRALAGEALAFVRGLRRS